MCAAIGLLAGVAVAALAEDSPHQVVVTSQCAFDQRCDLAGSACHDWHTDVTLSVWKLPTQLRSRDRDAPPFAYGFEQIGGYAEIEIDGRKLRGDAFFDTRDSRSGPVWEDELPDAPISFRARNASFDAWLMSIATNGEAELTVTQNDGRDRGRHKGRCDVTLYDLATAWKNSWSGG